MKRLVLILIITICGIINCNAQNNSDDFVYSTKIENISFMSDISLDVNYESCIVSYHNDDNSVKLYLKRVPLTGCATSITKVWEFKTENFEAIPDGDYYIISCKANNGNLIFVLKDNLKTGKATLSLFQKIKGMSRKEIKEFFD